MSKPRGRGHRGLFLAVLVAVTGTALFTPANSTSAQEPGIDGVYVVAENDVQGTTCPPTPFRQRLTDGQPALSYHYHVRIAATPGGEVTFSPRDGGDAIFSAPLAPDLSFRGGDRVDLFVDGSLELDGSTWEFSMEWVQRDATGTCLTNFYGRRDDTVPVPTSRPSPTSRCMIEGNVTDADGRPVRDIYLRLDAGIDQHAVTDASGHYRYSTPVAGVGFDPARDKVSVTLVAEGYGPAGTGIRFQVYETEQLGWLRSDEFLVADPAGCRRDFDLRAIPTTYTAIDPGLARWPDLIAVYQATWRAWALADRMGQVMDYGLPMRVYGWCDPGGRKGDDVTCVAPGSAAEYHGDSSSTRGRFPRPYIVLSTYATDRKVADNILYHEFGHALMADAFGNALPITPGRVKPHGGYYVNRDSGDSWVEGFANFYTLMVRKHIDGAQLPIVGGTNYELDILPWLANGKEEDHAVASLLLDLEDASVEAQRPAVDMTIDRVHIRQLRGVAIPVLDASVPLSSAPLASQVMVRYVDPAGVPIGHSSGLLLPNPSDRTRGRALVPMPPDVATLSLDEMRRRIQVTAVVGWGSGADDDRFAMPLRELWRTIVDTKTPDSSYPYPKTLDELYDTVLAPLDRDADGDSVGEVTQIYIRHGFFADTARGTSDHEHQPGTEEVGKSSHFGHRSDSTTYEDMLDRPYSPPIPERQAVIDTGGVPADVVVSIVFPGEANDRLGYGYIAPVVGDGMVELGLPPPGMGAQLTLLAVADGYEPEVLGQLDADAFWTEAESHDGQTFLEFSAELIPAPGDRCVMERDCPPTSGPSTSGDGRADPVVLVGLVGLIATILAAVAVTVVMTRRRRLAGARDGAVLVAATVAGSPAPSAVAGVGMAHYLPTHAVPAAGITAWPRPDPAAQPAHRLPPGLDVMVVEWLPSGWARVVASNGWSGWIDRRLLIPRDR